MDKKGTFARTLCMGSSASIAWFDSTFSLHDVLGIFVKRTKVFNTTYKKPRQRYAQSSIESVKATKKNHLPRN